MARNSSDTPSVFIHHSQRNATLVCKQLYGTRLTSLVLTEWWMFALNSCIATGNVGNAWDISTDTNHSIVFDQCVASDCGGSRIAISISSFPISSFLKFLLKSQTECGITPDKL